jgi:hypothetical protein
MGFLPVEFITLCIEAEIREQALLAFAPALGLLVGNHDYPHIRGYLFCVLFGDFYKPIAGGGVEFISLHVIASFMLINLVYHEKIANSTSEPLKKIVSLPCGM